MSVPPKDHLRLAHRTLTRERIRLISNLETRRANLPGCREEFRAYHTNQIRIDTGKANRLERVLKWLADQIGGTPGPAPTTKDPRA